MQSKGLIVAFLDAKCIPHDDWLEHVLKEMHIKSLDVGAGEFQMLYPSERILDKLHGVLYLQNGKNALKGYGFPAGNLFVRRQVFDEIGCFNEDQITGNDIEWTLRAHQFGFKSGFIPQAQVSYRGKTFRELTCAVSKYGRGVANQMKKREQSFFIYTTRNFLPLRLSTFSNALSYRGLKSLGLFDKFILWTGAFFIKILFGIALIRGKFLSFSEKRN